MNERQSQESAPRDIAKWNMAEKEAEDIKILFQNADSAMHKFRLGENSQMFECFSFLKQIQLRLIGLMTDKEQVDMNEKFGKAAKKANALNGAIGSKQGVAIAKNELLLEFERIYTGIRIIMQHSKFGIPTERVLSRKERWKRAMSA